MGFFTRQAELNMESLVSDDDFNYQLSMLYFPPDSVHRFAAPKSSVSSQHAYSASSSTRSGEARCSGSSGLGVTKAEEDFLSALGICLKPTPPEKECGLCKRIKPLTEFISPKDCGHEHCTGCCETHAEMKICLTKSLQIECPFPSCHHSFDIHQCRSLLSKESFDILNTRLTEAATPAAERIYCPFPDCSVFIPVVKSESCNVDAPDHTFVECYSCHHGFCLECNIPWRRECSLCAYPVKHTKFIGIKGCAHEYCTNCCKQHAEREILSGSSEIECLDPSCGCKFDIEQCSTLLSPNSLEILSIRQVEAAIPAAERVYCPFQDCSVIVLALKSDCSSSASHTLQECHFSCHRSFCLECNVPWERECDICADTVAHNEFISANNCDHEYCAECCKQHAEAKILSGNLQIDCPHPECRHNFDIDQCTTLLSPANFAILGTRLTEAAIPAERKVFCPFPDCSIMMERPDSRRFLRSSSATCYSCKRAFCLDCNVPWHETMTCGEYRADVENAKQDGDQKLRDLAKEKQWRECPNLQCRLVVEKKSGCNHITCRCKTEFCYICSRLWENKKPTCRCKLYS